MSLFSFLPSVPYPAPGIGYWLPQTSTINWCEEDYYATIYSAEIVNTLTNLMFVFLAIKGLRNCYREDHDKVFMVTFSGYLAVGTGSFLFHSTLKYPMQLVDELSMIYTTCFSCYASFSYKRGTAYCWGVAIFLSSLSVFITAYYHYLQDPTFHQNAYALLTATLLFRSMYMMEMHMRPYWRRQKQEEARQGKPMTMAEIAEQQRIDARDLKMLKSMWALVGYGLTIFLGGFAIWNMDNMHCSRLRKLRKEVGLPWGILLEGHGWWHIMTGIGAYCYITWGLWLRHCLNGKQDQYELVWPNMIFSIPEIRKRTIKKQQKKLN